VCVCVLRTSSHYLHTLHIYIQPLHDFNNSLHKFCINQDKQNDL